MGITTTKCDLFNATRLAVVVWFTCKRLLLECFRVIALPSSKKQSTGDHFSEGAQV